MLKPSPIRYRTKNWSFYNASLRKQGSLSIWFDPDMVWYAERSGKPGRPETFSDAAIQVCLTFKVLFGLPLRQTVGLIESLIRMAGLDWPAPDVSTLCRRQARIAVRIPHCASGQPLTLLVVSTGIKLRGDGEWLVRKHGTSRRWRWRKVQIAMDTVIPVRRNGRAWKADSSAAIARNEILRATRRLAGRCGRRGQGITFEVGSRPA